MNRQLRGLAIGLFVLAIGTGVLLAVFLPRSSGPLTPENIKNASQILEYQIQEYGAWLENPPETCPDKAQWDTVFDASLDAPFNNEGFDLESTPSDDLVDEVAGLGVRLGLNCPEIGEFANESLGVDDEFRDEAFEGVPEPETDAVAAEPEPGAPTPPLPPNSDPEATPQSAPSPPPPGPDLQCADAGGEWNGQSCDYRRRDCVASGGQWSGSSCNRADLECTDAGGEWFSKACAPTAALIPPEAPTNPNSYTFKYYLSEEATALMDRLDLTPTGQQLFKSATPVILTSDWCGNASGLDGCAALNSWGELTGTTIGIRKRAPARMTQVATHELAHAVWNKLSQTELDELKPHLDQAYKDNQTDLDHLLDNHWIVQGWIRDNPDKTAGIGGSIDSDNLWYNELHSFIADDISNIPAELENHYGLYFNNSRRAILNPSNDPLTDNPNPNNDGSSTFKAYQSNGKLKWESTYHPNNGVTSKRYYDSGQLGYESLKSGYKEYYPTGELAVKVDATTGRGYYRTGELKWESTNPVWDITDPNPAAPTEEKYYLTGELYSEWVSHPQSAEIRLKRKYYPGGELYKETIQYPIGPSHPQNLVYSTKKEWYPTGELKVDEVIVYPSGRKTTKTYSKTGELLKETIGSFHFGS